jgi:hypothetical protein
MTQEADDDIILPDRFQYTHKIPMNQSGIFRIFVLKKIGKIKTTFCTKFDFQIQKYISKNGSKKLRGMKIIVIGFLTSKNAEFSSWNGFGHHEIDLYPSDAKTPHFSILRCWENKTLAIWVSKDLK